MNTKQDEIVNAVYNPKNIEQTLQQQWEERGVFKYNNSDTNSFYCLSMFPYPSGQLHVGHVRNYTLGDAISRYKRMQGYNVLQPMGWDSFGLPAENAARKHNSHPAEWTYSNIASMKKQLTSLGLAYDWDREVITCKPNYYKWQQWLFIKMYEKGLVYRKESMVNWDPVDKTVLANEQVIDGKGWRSGATIERKAIPQWFIKITDYANELLDDVDSLNWPKQVKIMQKNWIGKSEGTCVKFDIELHGQVEVFTTRVDTLFGVSAIVLAPEHPIALKLAEEDNTILAFINECKQTAVSEEAMETMEKKGTPTKLTAKHPLTGANIQVWVANYVIMDYGSGCVMSVPAHDQRDYEFATKYNLPINIVIQPENPDENSTPYLKPGKLVNSAEFSGLESSEAINQINAQLKSLNRGHSFTQFRLRDWGVSRQRYWGTPIPMIYCKSCGIVPESYENLPVKLPEDIDYSDTINILDSDDTFKSTSCPKCGNQASREVDTFDTFFDSSWYYIRYLDPHNHHELISDNNTSPLPVDLYIGGIEHAILHLLYARFLNKVIRDIGLIKNNEPFNHLLTQGMVLKDGFKMSKSKGNTVSPNEMIDEYGADATRLFILFAAPPTQSLEWSDQGIQGAFRFLTKLWKSCYSDIDSLAAIDEDCNHSELANAHSILDQISQDYDKIQLNTVVSGIMKLVNCLTSIQDTCAKKGLYKMIFTSLNPISPHISHTLWIPLKFKQELDSCPPIVPNQNLIDNIAITIAVKINNKIRGTLNFPANTTQEVIEKTVLNDKNINRWIVSQPKRIIYVPEKLLNIII
ncbi:MAG TPA: leucine--tRNA ligase [Gammaproteobacteria bacterium]|nr:leucine--tRNA ligase [Gammaproteobacteria bacterium]